MYLDVVTTNGTWRTTTSEDEDQRDEEHLPRASVTAQPIGENSTVALDVGVHTRPLCMTMSVVYFLFVPLASIIHVMGKMIVGNERLKSFFLQCARQSFRELGLNDSAITDYVANVLTTFARTDHLYRVRTPKGRHLDSVVEMLSTYLTPADGEQHLIQREREFRKYVGDYTLFMSGLFRTHVEQHGVLDYYFSEGRRSYMKVSELDVALYHTGFLLFQELSKNFEYYSGALDYMRKAYFTPSPGEDPFGQFLRNVEGWMKTNLSHN